MKRNYFFILGVLILTIAITGCNMMRGAGKDVENAGSSIQKTVNHND
jgi:predicted small secreted protein